jgi:beta-lactamase superfamily II metal-dependent hydrolase
MPYTDVNILNVGRGSCAVVESPSGRKSMVDINDGGELREAAGMSPAARFLEGAAMNSLRSKLVDPLAWCKRNGITQLFRFILSHPDADHMAGLRRVLRGELPTENFWDIPHNRGRSKRDFKNDSEYEDWRLYQQLRAGGLSGIRLLKPLRGDANHYWIDDDIEILSPTKQLVEECDEADVYNDASYVLRISHRPSSVLLPGDVESKGWNSMIDAGVDLSADVLVASHHGRMSGYSEKALEEINPSVVIISTDRLDPAHDAEKEYRKWTKHVYSTRKEGTMWVRMHDDGSFDIRSHAGKLAGFVRGRV